MTLDEYEQYLKPKETTSACIEEGALFYIHSCRPDEIFVAYFNAYFKCLYYKPHNEEAKKRYPSYAGWSIKASLDLESKITIVGKI